LVRDVTDEALLSLAKRILFDEGVRAELNGKDSVRFVKEDFAKAHFLRRFDEPSGRIWRCNLGFDSEPGSTVDCISVYIHESGKSYVHFGM
jgi:hypothetical protein